jgi:methylmalonyl-CoA/ethylmalonyl-CoA epimerase
MTEMLLTEIDHVAIAVPDLDAAVAYYEETFGATVAHRERIDSDGVEEALLKVADSYVQLLTPTSDSSPVAKYLEKKGPGIHHVGYRVADCAAACSRSRTMAAKSSTRPPAPARVAPRLPSFTRRAPSAR